MKRIIILLLVLLMNHGCRVTKQADIYALAEADKIILEENGPKQYFYWEMKDDQHLWSFELGDVGAINEYRNSLILELGSQEFELAIEKEATQSLDKSLIGTVNDGDRINALLVHTDSIGKVRQINFLESQILNYQISRFPLFSQPTEFHGFITRHQEEGRLRIYFAASDTEWPPRPTVIIEILESELQSGWKLIGHLHNHYCKKDKNYIGILAPSLADAQYYKMLKDRFDLDVALITNGFHTVEIESKDFDKFESH